MTNTTSFPGIVTIDPISGLINYVLDIKPYHTKVFETLVEYVYTDYVNVNIVDKNVLAITMIEQDGINTTINEGEPFEISNASAQATIVVLGGQIISVTITTPGSEYTFGDVLTVTGIGPGSGLSLEPATLGVGNSLATVTIVNPGSGYTDGTYLNVVLTCAPNDGILTVPTSITEMFDFFITAPLPTPVSLLSTDVANDIVHFTGNFASLFSIGDLIVITGSSTGNDGKYHLLTVGYDQTTGLTDITLNSLSGTNGTTGVVTIYKTDTNYSFVFPIQSAVVGPLTITEPVTGTVFNNISTFTVQGNATRAIQAGSIFQAVVTQGVNAVPYVYRAAFVQFIPSFNTDGSRNPPGDTTVIGVELDTVFTDAVISTGFIIPFNITGYDDRYDAPYDGMAGYHIISG